VSAPAFFARWRVRLGYPLAIVVLVLAHPTPQSILYGALVGIIGLLIRALAAGHLQKQAVLTVTGPYAYTRNPLYFGSAILTLGVAIATHSWIPALLLLGYFALFYSIVMRREEQELRAHHGTSFDDYARSVPLFVPRLAPAKLAGGEGAFSFAQYKKNREYRAAIGFLFLLLVLLAIWHLRSTQHHVSAERAEATASTATQASPATTRRSAQSS
jgi:protein-S-isoprenylcysteine O-methyltransferase Ste14